MKILRIIAILGLCIGLLGSMTSCFVLVERDSGKHPGWFKNSNNPHHPNSTNPGHSDGKSRNKKHK